MLSKNQQEAECSFLPLGHSLAISHSHSQRETLFKQRPATGLITSVAPSAVESSSTDNRGYDVYSMIASDISKPALTCYFIVQVKMVSLESSQLYEELFNTVLAFIPRY